MKRILIINPIYVKYAYFQHKTITDIDTKCFIIKK